MTVVRLEVDAFKRLRAARLSPSPTGLVPVRGRNAQGKSSLIEAMEAALCGAEASQELPIHAGERGAMVVLDLGDLVVQRTWTRDSGGRAKTALVVTNAAGSPLRSPQAVLDGLRGRFADPVKFLGMKPEEQVKEVMRSIGLDQRLAELEDRVAGWYAQRRDVGRDADRLHKAARVLVDALPPPAAISAGDAAALTAELQAARTHNLAITRAGEEMQQVEADGRREAERLERLRADVAQCEARRDALRARYTELRSFHAAAAFIDEAQIVAAIGALEAEQNVRAQHDAAARAVADADVADAAHREADAGLAAARAEVGALLATAAFPVAGMSYDPDQKMLAVNGIPFSQASHAEKLKISAAIAMAGAPAIRVLFVREGSLLDDDSLAMLSALAAERGFQVWCEIVDSAREGAGVWIEDGEAFDGEDGAGCDAATTPRKEVTL